MAQFTGGVGDPGGAGTPGGDLGRLARLTGTPQIAALRPVGDIGDIGGGPIIREPPIDRIPTPVDPGPAIPPIRIPPVGTVPPILQVPPVERFPPVGTVPPILQVPPVERFPPVIIDPPPIPFPFPPPLPPMPDPTPKTATQLARAAIVQLNASPVDIVAEAMTTVRNKNVTADHLLDYLERRVRVGEVLNQLASTWSETTASDFGDAFQMDRSKRPVMDAIVAMAILNDPQLDEEILVENTPRTGPSDLVDNRVIVDQWPRGGAALEPPYVILVAVEYRNVAAAQQIVDSIMGELVEQAGVKVPRATAEQLRARG